MKGIVIEDPKKFQEKIVQNTKFHIYDSPPTNTPENRKEGRAKNTICFFLPSTNQREGINC